jgi:hypothetical protein
MRLPKPLRLRMEMDEELVIEEEIIDFDDMKSFVNNWLEIINQRVKDDLVSQGLEIRGKK